jgi:DNA-binding transcriptional ArsR family regulator
MGHRHDTATLTVSLLDTDPDLGSGLRGHELEAARKQAVALTVDVGTDRWDDDRFAQGAEDGWLGLLLIEGLMVRKVVVGRRAACELFGPGDLIRPWDPERDYEPLAIGVDAFVLRPARLAILDHAFALRIAPWPSITSKLLARVAGRARYLAVTQAVTQLRRIDARLLILFWLLAERWGRVALDGVRIGLPLAHEVLAMLVGAHRPTVTLALARLTSAGLLTRERSDQWLLTNDAIDALGRPEIQ